ncbi:MAG: exodeoxyribonuclease VII small subunit [Epsilonproteobacteria bacterium]|nr:exodeoxyribonuclease VII small subunit [Campylobacterota bacterium]
MENFVFEDELEASKEILNKLLDPSITLSQSLKLYEEGLEHIKIAQRLIEEAKLKITKIEQGFSQLEN